MVVVLSGIERDAVGRKLAESLGWHFVDGDDAPIDRLRGTIREWVAERRNVVVSSRHGERLAVHPSVRFLQLLDSGLAPSREVPVIDVAQPVDAVVAAARTLISI
jgi:hypothetical protein